MSETTVRPSECPNPHCDEGMIRGTLVGCCVCKQPVTEDRRMRAYRERSSLFIATATPDRPDHV